MFYNWIPCLEDGPQFQKKSYQQGILANFHKWLIGFNGPPILEGPGDPAALDNLPPLGGVYVKPSWMRLKREVVEMEREREVGEC